MINLDSITNENNKNTMKNGHIYLIIHTEFELVVLDQKKQIHYLIQ